MLVSQRGRPWLFRATLFAALACLLIWEVTSRTLAAYFANVASEQALAVRPHQSTALLKIADQKMSELDSTGGSDRSVQTAKSDRVINAQIRALAESALLDNPLNARALRILGQVADQSRDETLAWKFMQIAARYSMNESLAVIWLVDKHFEKKDFEATLYYVDLLLRTRPQFISYVMPTLAWIAENKDAAGSLRKLLADNPPWRAAFFGALPGRVSDARTPLELLTAVKDSPNPPTNDDLREYLNFLIARKFYALAYYAWLQFLPTEQLSGLGLLFNASFETDPSGLPFDWVIRPGAGVSIDIGPAPDREEGRALNISFDQGRIEFGGVTQLIVLTPGKYRFNAQYTGEVIGQRGLKWRIVCANGATISESRMIAGRAPTWKNIEFSFNVPADCPAEYLRLDLDARMSSEQFVSGHVWFDDLWLARVGDGTDK
jgi:hypothetical protein